MSETPAVNRFDDIVIGSSPLMLMQAGELARAGRNVGVIEREESLGGSWQTGIVCGEPVEIACHVIEVFPGVYEKLEELSGIPFVRLDAQPIRIGPGKTRVAYFSRAMMLVSGLRMVLGWVKARLEILSGTSTDRNVLINFQKKLRSYISYQLPVFFRSHTMCGPRDGFVDFMERLTDNCSAAGVTFVKTDVKTMTRQGSTWCLATTTGETFEAFHVHCTTSTNLRRHGPGRYEAALPRFAYKRSVVVTVPLEEIRVSQTYVAFWNSCITRISRIDMPCSNHPFQQFLVEFLNPTPECLPERHPDQDRAIREHMVKAHIIGELGTFAISGSVNCTFTMNVDQLNAGRIDEGLWGYYSMGNLAAGVAAWMRSDILPPIPDMSE